jgi:hypothetical protein
MYNWSTDTTRLQADPEKYAIFVLEQRINFGLNNAKLSLAQLRKYWDKLNIDTNKRNYLQRIVWPKS